jgi:isocitrate dehydrogenase
METKSTGDKEPGGGAAGSGSESLYEKMSKAVRDSLEKAGSLTEESLERALKESREWARQFRAQYGDDIPKVAEFLRRDFREAIRITREQTRKKLDWDRLGVGVLDFVQRMAEKAGNRLDGFASRLGERLTYKTGEVTGAGTLTCTACGQQVILDGAARIPPCPKCRGTAFRRSY